MNNSSQIKSFMLLVAIAALAFSPVSFAQADFAAGEKTFETPIGKLEFNNGYASPETSKLLYDRMDFQRAVQVYLQR